MVVFHVCLEQVEHLQGEQPTLRGTKRKSIRGEKSELFGGRVGDFFSPKQSRLHFLKIAFGQFEAELAVFWSFVAFLHRTMTNQVGILDHWPH